MPANFFSLIWPFAVGLLALAGVAVILAAAATLVAALARLRQPARDAERQANPDVEASGYGPGPARSFEQPATETVTPDGVHYYPLV